MNVKMADDPGSKNRTFGSQLQDYHRGGLVIKGPS